jgi:anti-sigma B factor antagonist
MPEAAVLTQQTADGVTVVSFAAESLSITEDLISEVSEGLLEVTKGGPPRVLVDMSAVEFFSSSFIEVLFRVWNRLKVKDGGRFGICCLQPYCREILQVTNLDKVWEIYETREEGLAALGE